MDTKTLCLGVLTLGPASGYEIKKAFEEAFSHFFVASFGSIYPALAELAGRGWVTVTEEEQDKRPAKKVYRITDAGRDALAAELAAAEPRHKVRSEFLALVFFSHLLSGERLREVLDRRMADTEGSLRRLEGFVNDECLPPGVRFAAGFGVAALGAGLDYLRQNGDWLLEETEVWSKEKKR